MRLLFHAALYTLLLPQSQECNSPNLGTDIHGHWVCTHRCTPNTPKQQNLECVKWKSFWWYWPKTLESAVYLNWEGKMPWSGVYVKGIYCPALSLDCYICVMNGTGLQFPSFVNSSAFGMRVILALQKGLGRALLHSGDGCISVTSEFSETLWG
jgi:hypothetical protein